MHINRSSGSRSRHSDSGNQNDGRTRGGGGKGRRTSSGSQNTVHSRLQCSGRQVVSFASEESATEAWYRSLCRRYHNTCLRFQERWNARNSDRVAALATVDVSYAATSKQKKSVQETDAEALFQLIASGAKADVPTAANYLVGARSIDNISGLPSDITITGNAYLVDLTQATRPKDAKPAQTFSQVYDDEGFAHWDISAGIPFTGINQLQYGSDGTVQAKTVSKANAYGMAHWYPMPVDLKGDYPWQPSLVAGLPISGKPLNKPFVGAAFGLKNPLPIKVNFFAGAVFNKVFAPSTLAKGSTATAAQLNADLASHRVTKLLYGVDISITSLVKAVSSATKTNATKTK